MQHTATHATHCNTMYQRPETSWQTYPKPNVLQHAATHCNTLQHTALLCTSAMKHLDRHIQKWTYYNMLQHTATHATHCNTMYQRHETSWQTFALSVFHPVFLPLSLFNPRHTQMSLNLFSFFLSLLLYPSLSHAFSLALKHLLFFLFVSFSLPSLLFSPPISFSFTLPSPPHTPQEHVDSRALYIVIGLPLSLSRSLVRSFSLSLSRSLLHTLSPSLSLHLAPSFSLSVSHSVSLARSYALSVSISLSLSLPRACSLYLSLT